MYCRFQLNSFQIIVQTQPAASVNVAVYVTCRTPGVGLNTFAQELLINSVGQSSEISVSTGLPTGAENDEAPAQLELKIMSSDAG